MVRLMDLKACPLQHLVRPCVWCSRPRLGRGHVSLYLSHRLCMSFSRSRSFDLAFFGCLVDSQVCIFGKGVPTTHTHTETHAHTHTHTHTRTQTRAHGYTCRFWYVFHGA